VATDKLNAERLKMELKSPVVPFCRFLTKVLYPGEV
jgi:hypothetical protein